MRQKLFKVITSITLMVSVFFLNFSSLSFASEQEDFDIGLYINAGGSHYNAEFVYDYYSEDGATYAVGDLNVSLRYKLNLEEGYVYNGVVFTNAYVTYKYTEDSYIHYDLPYISSFSIDDPADGIDVSFYYSRDGEDTFKLSIYFVFSDYYHGAPGELQGTSVFNFTQAAKITQPKSPRDLNYTATWTSATDYAGSLYRNLPGDVNLGGVVSDSSAQQIQQQIQISQQEMQQQQQIANQQSQQSQQQHNSLINGYDNAANDTMLADKNSVLKGFEQQQDQAMSDGQQYVADFSANYDTAPLVAMAPAFMMISTWFNDLWGGMGNFSTVLIVGLMLCVAGYILKLKH